MAVSSTLAEGREAREGVFGQQGAAAHRVEPEPGQEGRRGIAGVVPDRHLDLGALPLERRRGDQHDAAQLEVQVGQRVGAHRDEEGGRVVAEVDVAQGALRVDHGGQLEGSADVGGEVGRDLHLGRPAPAGRAR